MKVEVERVRINEINESIVKRWSDLARVTGGSARIFSGPFFCSAINRVEGNAEIVIFHTAGKIYGIQPLQRDRGIRGRLGSYGQIGREISDYFSCVSDGETPVDLAQGLKRAKVHSLFASWVNMQLESNHLKITPAAETFRLIKAAHHRNMWETLRELNRKFSADVDRCQRNLSRDFSNVSIEVDSEFSKEAFAWLIETKLQQSIRTKQPNHAFGDEQIKQQLLEMIATGGTEDRCLLSVLRADGRIIAAHLGIQGGRMLHYWFPAYDVRYSKYSPGMVLLANILKTSPELGLAQLDFGEGVAKYKLMLSNQREQLGKVLHASSLYGNVLVTQRRISWALERIARSRVSTSVDALH